MKSDKEQYSCLSSNSRSRPDTMLCNTSCMQHTTSVHILLHVPQNHPACRKQSRLHCSNCWEAGAPRAQCVLIHSHNMHVDRQQLRLLLQHTTKNTTRQPQAVGPHSCPGSVSLSQLECLSAACSGCTYSNATHAQADLTSKQLSNALRKLGISFVKLYCIRGRTVGCCNSNP